MWLLFSLLLTHSGLVAALLAESNAPVTVVDLKQPTADLAPSGALRFRLVRHCVGGCASTSCFCEGGVA